MSRNNNPQKTEIVGLDGLGEFYQDQTNEAASEVPSLDVERAKLKKENRIKAFGIVGVSAFVLAAGAGYGLLGWVGPIQKAISFNVENEGSVAETGEGKIIDIDFDIKPITLSTATTLVEGTKVSFEQKLTGPIDLSLGSTTVTRDATVETEITVNPGDVDITYDPSKKEHKLSFVALNTALSTKVSIPTGKAHTVDKTGSIALLPAQWITQVSEAIDGTFGTDNSKVPIVREMANGTLNVNEGLEKFADLNIVRQVDLACTEKIPTAIPDFDEQLEENFRIGVKGQLVDSTETVPDELMDLSLREIQKLVDDADVQLPENYTINPDQEVISELEDYKKGKFFTSTLDDDKKMPCGVDLNPNLKLVEKE
ncbi:MAG: hypothetical protein JWO54_497 [Candidatus Saccharibacteria bacterium]|nr:hypothetical protein [Candidatus Saccharibacteria bacterium]